LHPVLFDLELRDPASKVHELGGNPVAVSIASALTTSPAGAADIWLQAG